MTMGGGVGSDPPKKMTSFVNSPLWQSGRVLISNVWSLKGASICKNIATSVVNVSHKTVLTVFTRHCLAGAVL